MCGVFSVNINFILSNDYLMVFILFSIELHGTKFLLPYIFQFSQLN